MKTTRDLIEKMVAVREAMCDLSDVLTYMADGYEVSGFTEAYPFEVDLDTQITRVTEWIEAVKEGSPQINTKLATNYSEEADRTFIIRETYQNDELIKEEVVGFYSGEPNNILTASFTNNLVATYEL